MNTLKLNILPSTHTNDHQVRIEIDGEDYLPDELGIDPVSFFAQKELYTDGILRIARCDCGVEGCGDSGVIVEVGEKTVVWEVENENRLTFEKEEYFKYMKSISNNYSWENLERRVERLVGEILINTTHAIDYKYKWASSRIETGKIVISYEKKDDQGYTKQELIRINWSGEDVEDALSNAEDLIQKCKVQRQTTSNFT